MRFKRERLATN